MALIVVILATIDAAICRLRTSSGGGIRLPESAHVRVQQSLRIGVLSNHLRGGRSVAACVMPRPSSLSPLNDDPFFFALPVPSPPVPSSGWEELRGPTIRVDGGR